ncbi:GTP cyclohydrolase FolE2 [Palleronia sp. LCG004]|uniref:GTP cyclohydrolase FolE2 n=1 Tax=Palleronia sp. LCG004 TaxID=3079304 RepID=UPI002943824F|nr:GTP cyclohydrolase FolE2 [Palleronia sp. LCG004]WOI57580.1 GTP cyclohydrolase FolE2 [Palleronia sp. LCG004]
MDLSTSEPDRDLSPEEVRALLARLSLWAADAGDDKIAAVDPRLRAFLPGQGWADSGDLSVGYDAEFKSTEAYRATLPDLQNSVVEADGRVLQHVGISNFRLPIHYLVKDSTELILETSVTGTVSLGADRKGINMSRIMRSFYRHADRTFSFRVIESALDDYKADLEAHDARIQMRISYPMKLSSLRSGLEGYQYYDIALELVDRGGVRSKILHLDYVYSSTCPCSLALSEHARSARGRLATPHSQRSVARISVVLDEEAGTLWFEDLVELCRHAVPTETQVMVKREDEQAFAELNAAHPIFVEDAARHFARALRSDTRIGDFRIVASHQESLHSHDAVSVLTEGATFDHASLDPRLFSGLVHGG